MYSEDLIAKKVFRFSKNPTEIQSSFVVGKVDNCSQSVGYLQKIDINGLSLYFKPLVLLLHQ